eukprot:scaffold895_cov315-Pinguiococcus_pyrenoidosus.AAC.2
MPCRQLWPPSPFRCNRAGRSPLGGSRCGRLPHSGPQSAPEGTSWAPSTGLVANERHMRLHRAQEEIARHPYRTWVAMHCGDGQKHS